MKVKDLTEAFIMMQNEDDLRDILWHLRSALTCSRKTLKKLSLEPLTTDRKAKEYAGVRRANAHHEAMLEAVMCRQDEIYGEGVLSSYDHSTQFC
jgi:hypothetical protein